MKKLILGAAATLLTLGAFAQGTINFANATSTGGFTLADRTVRFGTPVTVLSPVLIPGSLVSSNAGGFNLSGLRAALIYAPSTVTDRTQFQLATFNGDYPTFRASTSANSGAWYSKIATLNGINAGDTVNMAVLVWDINVAASPFDQAAKYWGLYGESATFTYTVPNSQYPAPGEFLPQNLRAFTLGWVPEPTSFALIGLGAAAMMIFRRRKD